jgi:hypothetical protein
MNGFGPRGLCSLNDALNAEVIFAGAGTNTNGFVGPHDVHCSLIRLLINRNGFNTQFLGRAYDPDSNFPSICNQQFLEHTCAHSLREGIQLSSIVRSWPHGPSGKIPGRNNARFCHNGFPQGKSDPDSLKENHSVGVFFYKGFY